MSEEDDVPEQIADNEAVFRDVNEAIEAGRWPGEEQAIAFRCECGQLGCSQLIELTAGEYERVRAHPRRFIVAPGHQMRDAEKVVEHHDHYSIVEKRAEAGRVAEDEDPRS